MPYAHLFSILASRIESVVIHGGYGILFLLTILEGIPLVGMVVPGHVAIIAGGFLAKIGVFNLWLVLAISLVGALIGDFIGYSLGKVYGIGLIDKLRPYFFISESQIEKTRAILSKHTGKAMIIGRFSPVTRALMPFFVGTSHAKIGRFWLFNIIGGITWIISSVLLGYAFGASYHLVAGYIGKSVFVAVICAGLIIWGYRFVNVRFHIFARYELFALILNLVSFWALAKMIQDAWAVQSFVANFDIAVNGFMATHITPFIVTLGRLMSDLGNTAVTSGLGILVTIYLVLQKKWKGAIVMFLSLASTGVILGFLKEFFMRDRPWNALEVIVNDPSFPSGHAGMAAAFFVILAYIVVRKLPTVLKRELFIVFCVLAVVAIGLSRLILNVHWASDVVAGWSLGVFCATGSILLVRYIGTLVRPKEKSRP